VSEQQRIACDAILLGSLLQRSAAFGIWPPPKDPYPGITFKTLADQIRGMQVLDDCNQSRGVVYYSGMPPGGHGTKDSIEASIRSRKDRVYGLSLGSFLPQRDRKIRSKWGFPSHIPNTCISYLSWFSLGGFLQGRLGWAERFLRGLFLFYCKMFSLILVLCEAQRCTISEARSHLRLISSNTIEGPSVKPLPVLK
jgi:hypothetical protein